MRNAHRPKALPNRKLPRGIERQDELIELIEKRFHQEDLIRDALQKADAKSTTAESAYADETSAEGVPSKKNATTRESTSSAQATTEGAYADEVTAESVPSAKDATTREGAYADETSAEGVPSKQDATIQESAPLADSTSSDSDTPFAKQATAESVPSAKEEHASDASSPSAEAEETASATVEAPLAEPAESVTIRWHGQNETITDPRIWLTVFDTVREAGDVITREVAHRRFHGESYWKTCDALYLSTGTYYHHVRAILHYAFACAVYHRLIDPRPKHFSLKAK